MFASAEPVSVNHAFVTTTNTVPGDTVVGPKFNNEPDDPVPGKSVPTEPVPVDPEPAVSADPILCNVDADSVCTVLASGISAEPAPVDHVSVNPIPVDTVPIDHVHIDPVSVASVNSTPCPPLRNIIAPKFNPLRPRDIFVE
jgi:hypothetical protein